MLRRIAKWLKRLALALVALALVGALTVFLVIRHHESELPSVEQLRSGYQPPQVTRILARDGSLARAIGCLLTSTGAIVMANGLLFARPDVAR